MHYALLCAIIYNRDIAFEKGHVQRDAQRYSPSSFASNAEHLQPGRTMTSSPKIWFDASTTLRLRNHSPVGLTRVEANVLRSALQLSPNMVRFCSFDRYGKCIEEVSAKTVERLLARYGSAGNAGHGTAAKPRSSATRIGKSLERSVRLFARGALSKARFQLGLKAHYPNWSPGDIFVLSGATWDSIDAKSLESIAGRCGLRMVVIINDMIPVLYPHHFHDQGAVAMFERFAECTARSASLTLFISRSTRDDFHRFAAQRGVTPSSNEVVYLGDDCAQCQDKRPQGLPSELTNLGFVLCVGTIQIRKNHQLLYQLWRRFAEEGRRDIPKLVIAGAPGWMTGDLLYQIKQDPLVAESIVVVNQVNDEGLAWLYQNCQFSVYPSLYEGWGLPIAEGLRFGRPCIASDTSSMPEASQGLATHLDPQDFGAWYTAIDRWSTQPELLRSLSENIQNNYRDRSWLEFGNEVCDRILRLAKQDDRTKVA
jgi:glycosyltransferase involved in cell wall biosynthesis